MSTYIFQKSYFIIYKIFFYIQRKFDEIFSARLSGLETADDFYRSISSKTKLINIDIPVLCIHSKDDLFTPGIVIPYGDWDGYTNLTYNSYVNKC